MKKIVILTFLLILCSLFGCKAKGEKIKQIDFDVLLELADHYDEYKLEPIKYELSVEEFNYENPIFINYTNLFILENEETGLYDLYNLKTRKKVLEGIKEEWPGYFIDGTDYSLSDSLYYVDEDLYICAFIDSANTVNDVKEHHLMFTNVDGVLLFDAIYYEGDDLIELINDFYYYDENDNKVVFSRALSPNGGYYFKTTYYSHNLYDEYYCEAISYDEYKMGEYLSENDKELYEYYYDDDNNLIFKGLYKSNGYAFYDKDENYCLDIDYDILGINNPNMIILNNKVYIIESYYFEDEMIKSGSEDRYKTHAYEIDLKKKQIKHIENIDFFVSYADNIYEYEYDSENERYIYHVSKNAYVLYQDYNKYNEVIGKEKIGILSKNLTIKKSYLYPEFLKGYSLHKLDNAILAVNLYHEKYFVIHSDSIYELYNIEEFEYLSDSLIIYKDKDDLHHITDIHNIQNEINKKGYLYITTDMFNGMNYKFLEDEFGIYIIEGLNTVLDPELAAYFGIIVSSDNHTIKIGNTNLSFDYEIYDFAIEAILTDRVIFEIELYDSENDDIIIDYYEIVYNVTNPDTCRKGRGIIS